MVSRLFITKDLSEDTLKVMRSSQIPQTVIER